MCQPTVVLFLQRLVEALFSFLNFKCSALKIARLMVDLLADIPASAFILLVERAEFEAILRVFLLSWGVRAVFSFPCTFYRMNQCFLYKLSQHGHFDLFSWQCFSLKTLRNATRQFCLFLSRLKLFIFFHFEWKSIENTPHLLNFVANWNLRGRSRKAN